MSYTIKIATLNAAANQSLLGVQLGRFCIEHNIPARKVASDLDVSKSVVYSWFTGGNDIGKHLRPKVESYYHALPSLVAGGYGT